MDLSAALNQLKNKITGATGGQTSENTQETSQSSRSLGNAKEEVSVFSNTSSIIEENSKESEKDFIEKLEASFNEIMNFLDEHSNPELSIEQNPVNTDEIKTASKKVSTGDVFEVPGENGLFIKTSSGDYKKLDITSDTYEKLFSKNNSYEDFFAFLQPDSENQTLSDNIEKLFDTPESRELILSCFSEDDKGNITFTIPNSNSSFTLEKGKSLSDYDLDMEYSNSPVGYGMIELALGSQRCEKELDLLYENQKYYIEIISKEEKNHSTILTNTIKDALDFTADDSWLKYEILDYYELTTQDKSDEEIKDVVSEDIYNIMQNIPSEELKNANIDYIYSLIWQEIDAEEIQDLETDPYFSRNRSNAIDETQMLSAFGLNKNYEKIDDKTFKQAEQYIQELELYVTTEFDEKVLATLIDDNKKGIEIIEYIKENENKNITYYNLQACLEKSLKDDTNIEFLKKLTDLNVKSSTEYLLREDLINENNIDLVLEWQDTNEIKNNNGELTLEELKALNCATTLYTNEEIAEYMKGENFPAFIETVIYTGSILENGYKDDGTTRSNLLKEELKMVLESALNGQDPNDIAVPSVKSISEGIEVTKMGDVFEVEGEDFIYFTINDKECIQLDISKDTYNKLFPPIQKYMSSQGNIGDCYLVSSLNNMMTDPSMRGILLQCFSEDENGNITVDLPNGDYTFTLENGKELLDYFPEEVTFYDEEKKEEELIPAKYIISDSSLGMQMLEVCYGIYLQNEETQVWLDQLEYLYEDIEEEDKLYSDKEKSNLNRMIEIVNDYTESKEGIDDYDFTYRLMDGIYEIFENDNTSDIKSIVSDIFPYATEIDKAKFVDFAQVCKNSNMSADYIMNLLYIDSMNQRIEDIQKDLYGTNSRGNGGKIEKVFDSFGIECETVILKDDNYTISELLTNPDIKIVAGGTYGSSDDSMLNEELFIAGNHAYTIYPKQQENGEYLFEVINPWDESRTSILTEDQMNEYFSHIDYIYT